MEKEYIERERLLTVLERNFGYTGGAAVLKQLIEVQPAADVVEVKHGEWVAETERTGTYSHCSECGCRCAGYTPNYKFCPKCGRPLKGE